MTATDPSVLIHHPVRDRKKGAIRSWEYQENKKGFFDYF